MGLRSKLKGALSRKRDPALEFLQLAREVAETIEGVFVVAERQKDLIIELRLEGGNSSHEFFVGNMCAEWQALPVAEQRTRVESFLRELVGAELRGPTTWDEARTKLVPVVRGMSTFLVGGKQVPAVRRPFVPLLYEAVVLDSDRGMEYVSPEDLDHWRVTADEAFAVAHANLASCEDSVSDYPGAGEDTLLWVGTNDDYQSSRILLRGWLASFAGRVGGQPVAVLPERCTLVVGALHDIGQLDLLLQIATERAQESARYISMVPYTVDSGGVSFRLTWSPTIPSRPD